MTATSDPTPAAILVDANLLMWAHHRQFPHHEQARRWIADTFSDLSSVGLPWPSLLAFVRLSTHPRILQRPLDVATAPQTVATWLARPNVHAPGPTERHLMLLGEMLAGGRAAGNHAPDAHLAALAVEWGLVLVSADRDFARYPGLRWLDPSESW